VRGLRSDGRLILEPCVKLHDVKIYAQELYIGAYTDIVSGTELRHVSEIGRYCSIAAQVIIGQDRRSHPMDWLSTSHAVMGARLKGDQGVHSQEAQLPTTLGHDVWIGRDVMIMEGVTIGTGAVVGAQSLVNKDVPPYAIVAGSPARIIRYRFEEAMIEALLESHWWDYDLPTLGAQAIESPPAFLEWVQLQGKPPSARMKTVALSSRPLRFALENRAV